MENEKNYLVLYQTGDLEKETRRCECSATL